MKQLLLKTISVTITLLFLITFLPVLEYTAKAVDTTGYWIDYVSEPELSGSTYYINSAEELAWVAAQTQGENTFLGFNFVLKANIDLSSHYWLPISPTSDYAFEANFEGNGYTISNMKIGSPSDPYTGDYAGFIGCAVYVKIGNIRFDKAVICCSSHSTGILAGIISGSFYRSRVSNCSSSGRIIVGSGNIVGGLVGIFDLSDMLSCNSSCTIKFDSCINVGGLVGCCGYEGRIVIEESYTDCDITDISPDNAGYDSSTVGGIISSDGYLCNCYAKGSITIGNFSIAGGIVGSGGYVMECHADCDIKVGNESIAGGLAGSGVGEIINSYSTGNIIGGRQSTLGGLAGIARGVYNNYATGNVTGGDLCVAGGYIGEADDAFISNSFATGTVSCGAESYVGGFIGRSSNFNSDNFSIVNCCATGKVTGGDDSFVGGFAGMINLQPKNEYSNFIVSNCYGAGDIDAGTDSCAGGFAGGLYGLDGSNLYWNSDASQTVAGIRTEPVGAAEGYVYVPAYGGELQLADTTVPLTAQYLKSDNFNEKLNSFVMPPSYLQWLYSAFWETVSDKNNGYPVLLEVGGLGSIMSDTVQTETATPTSSTVLIDGKKVEFKAYNINGSNYFKLRDLAMALNGTESRFNVEWDGKLKAISVHMNSSYNPVGGELSDTSDLAKKTAVFNTTDAFYDGLYRLVGISRYKIDGNNYFKLRDIAACFKFGVDYDSSTDSILIDTNIFD